MANLADLLPEFKPPSNYKDKEKIGQYLEERKAQFVALAKDCAYTGTFDSVFLVDSFNKKPLRWDHSDGPGKPPVSVRVRNYILKTYPTGWSATDYNAKDPVARFIGFGTRRFLKLLGLELSLPAINKPLPLRMWFGNAEHRDIGDAICPHDFEKSGLTLEQAVRARRPVNEGEARQAWDAILADWKEPHADPEADAKLAIELAAQLGLLAE